MARGEIEWFLDGKLNASENCIDRHLADRANRTAIIGRAMNPVIAKKSAIGIYLRRFAN